MNMRPEWPRIKFDHSLAKGLVFAGLGGGRGSLKYLDSSPRGNHGTLMGMAPATDWVFDVTLNRWITDFDGFDDRIESNSSTGLAAFTGSITCCCWVKKADTGEQTGLIYQWHNSSPFEGFVLRSGYPSAGKAGWTSGGMGGVWKSASTRHDDGVWHHIALVGAGTGYTFYFDGIPDGSSSTGWAYDTAYATTFILGRYVATEYQGMLGDPLVYSRALSAAEIQQLADPSNVMLSGLILPPKRKYYGIISTIPTISRYFKIGKLFLSGHSS